MVQGELLMKRTGGAFIGSISCNFKKDGNIEFIFDQLYKFDDQPEQFNVIPAYKGSGGYVAV